MTYQERVVRGEEASAHLVQLFDSVQSRANTIGNFAAEGLSAGDTVLIVAQPNHWKSMAERMEKLGCNVNDALKSGQLTVLNASATLKKFMIGGAPDQGLFDDSVGDLVRGLLKHGKPLRAYGEMVDLLAGEGNFAGAQRLEDCWNRLGQQLRYTLFCGYSSAHFTAQQSAAALELVCRCHSEVRTDIADELGSWLLHSNGLTSTAGTV